MPSCVCVYGQGVLNALVCVYGQGVLNALMYVCVRSRSAECPRVCVSMVREC